MSEKSSTFIGMNDEMKLRLAYAEIARLKDDLSTANRGQVDFVAHDKAMREDFERQRQEDRQFYKEQMDNLKEFYVQQMKEQADRHKEELRQLREDNKENIRRLTIDAKKHQTASDNLIASLNQRISELNTTLHSTQLSETEAKWLARYRHRQQFKKSTEQKELQGL